MIGIGIVLLPGSSHAAFVGDEILGRPTRDAITVGALADQDVEVYFEYGTQAGLYVAQTGPQTYPAGTPIEVVLSPLAPDTRYYYRMRHRTPGSGTFDAGAERSFHTARDPGSTFTVAIQADSHLDAQSSPLLYTRTLENAAADAPDFFVDLGDTFMSEKFATDYAGVVARHLLQRPYLATVARSAPLFLVLGNHEGELGWLLDGTPENMAVWATNARKLYYPNPSPDGFYSGDTTVHPFVGQRESYYAWEWGDALFVVLDPFWATTTKPGQSGDNWDWTLGDEQYAWFRQTLEQSDARFKFVFSHHLTGGTNTEARGGIAGAPYFEWGGLNADDTPGFSLERPTWSTPIHQLMVANGVSVYFHGHDHMFVKEELDGIVYQEVPQPSHPSLNSTGNAVAYGYTSGVLISSSGHLRMVVSPSQARIDYVRAYLPENETGGRVNGEVAHSYTIDAPTTGIPTKRLLLVDDALPPFSELRRRITFQSRGTPLAPPPAVPGWGTRGDPSPEGASGGGARLIVQRVGGTPADVVTLDLPAARWVRTGRGATAGYRYRDARREDGPITSVVVNHTGVTIRGAGAALLSLAGAPEGAIALRLELGAGVIWCASAPAREPALRYDSTSRFDGVRDTSAPTTCPAVPH